jgi:hypothetical protein
LHATCFADGRFPSTAFPSCLWINGSANWRSPNYSSVSSIAHRLSCSISPLCWISLSPRLR